MVKKGLYQFTTFVLQYACCDLAFGVQGTRCEEGKAPLGVGCTIDHTRNLRPTDSTCTHDAGFDGDIERALREVFATQCLCGGCDGLHLGVCRDIGERLGEVVSAPDNLIACNDDATDGHFACAQGLACLFEGKVHIADIIGVNGLHSRFWLG